jgi:hypothetical protein
VCAGEVSELVGEHCLESLGRESIQQWNADRNEHGSALVKPG